MWGASTASHQVEGGTYNQWTVWELAHANDLSKTAHKRLGYLGNWKEISKQAENPENYVSGKGVEHYDRYKEDFQLIKKLNLNSFRFGIEWSRIEPKEGEWDEGAISHYHQYIDALRNSHIEPILNIWHWTMPVWFTKKGAFKKRKNMHYFTRFVEKIAKEYGKDITYVITLNEPNVYTSFGYVTADLSVKSILSLFI